MRKSILLAAAAVATTAAPAFAQEDAPFTGGYVGVSIGYDFQPEDGGQILFDRNLDGTFGDTVTTGVGADAFSPGFCNGAARTNAPAGGCKNDKDGISYSLRAGYDWQSGSMVVGAVAEIGKSDIRDSVTGYSTTPASYTMTREVDYLAALRGRVGFAGDRTLFYGTAGVAYANLDNSFSTTNTANGFTQRGKDSAWGAQFGAGVEHRLGESFSVGLEFLHTQLIDDNYRVRAGNSGTTPATNPFLLGNVNGTDFKRSDDRFRSNSVKLSANYRF